MATVYSSFRVRSAMKQYTVVLIILSGICNVAEGDRVHLTMVTQDYNSLWRLACFRSSPDTEADLTIGRPFPLGLPGSPIETSTSLPEGTKEIEYDGQRLMQLPQGVNSSGIFFCEGSARGLTTRVYSFTYANNRHYYPTDGQITRTVNKGENVTLDVDPRYGSTDPPLWRRIRNGVISELDDFDGQRTITIPSSQASHGDVYVIVKPDSSVGFAMFRLIVRGCAEGQWGSPDCIGICDMCYNGGVCDDETGDCICAPGFSGPNCLNACPQNSFGWQCEFNCSSSGNYFDPCYYVRIGLPDPYGTSCRSGYRGFTCSSGCSSGTFGARCLQMCHCLFPERGCSRFTGECTFDVCAEGWSGINCQIPDICPDGYYGINCTVKCHCADGKGCERHTGYCSNGCAPGSSCVSWKCPSGYFGKDCSEECHCLDAAPCGGLTGTCSAGLCVPEFQADLLTGKCQFALPVLSQPPSVTAESTSAAISWDAWGSHSMDSGDGPVVVYNVYFSTAPSVEWVGAGGVSVAYSQNVYSFVMINRLQPRAYYNFSVAAVREGFGGEGPRSPGFEIVTPPPGSSTIDGHTAGLIAVICVLVVVIIVIVALNYARFRRFNRSPTSAANPGETELDIISSSWNERKKSAASKVNEGYETGARVSFYEEVDLPPWAGEWVVPFESLSMGNTVLGTGNFGDVLLGTVIKDGDLLKAAVKKIKLRSSPIAEQTFMEEYHTLSYIGDHTNIVSILAVSQSDGVFYVALEYLPKGDLRSYLRDARSTSDDDSLSAMHLVRFALNIAEGMQHVAATGVIHRDLAARNILLDSNLVAKVTSFGFAAREDTFVEKVTSCIPPRWLSIESLKTRTYSTNSDV